MGFLEFMLGKRLLEDDFARGLSVLVTSPKLAARRSRENAHAFAEAAFQELNRPDARWKLAGDVTLLPSGAIEHPRLPDKPGILRMELYAPDGLINVVTLSEHASLRADEDQSSDQEIASEILAGARLVASFIDNVPASKGNLDLASASNRAMVLESIEKQAVRSGYWLVQTVGDRTALIPNPDAIQ